VCEGRRLNRRDRGGDRNPEENSGRGKRVVTGDSRRGATGHVQGLCYKKRKKNAGLAKHNADNGISISSGEKEKFSNEKKNGKTNSFVKKRHKHERGRRTS